MTQRTKVIGPRASTIWLLIAIAVVVTAGLVVGAVVFLPQRNAEQHYEAGVAFENAAEWEAAQAEYMHVISIDADYRDVKVRVAEVTGKLAAARASIPTATALALEQQYQHALGLINLAQWIEAQAELRAVFDFDPNYKDVQGQLATVNAQVAKLTPTITATAVATPTPVHTPTSTASPTPEGPSIKWLGFAGDQVGPSTSSSVPDGNSDGVFELVLTDVGKTITHIILWSADSNYRRGSEHWDTDAGESWALGVVDTSSGRRVEQIGKPMTVVVEGAKILHCYAAVATSGFRPGQYYLMIVTFSDGYSLTLKIRIP